VNKTKKYTDTTQSQVPMKEVCGTMAMTPKCKSNQNPSPFPPFFWCGGSRDSILLLSEIHRKKKKEERKMKCLLPLLWKVADIDIMRDLE
jgi:hypothetical protein